MALYNVWVNQTANATTPPLVVMPIAPGGGLGQPAGLVAITATITGTGAVSATVQPVVSGDGTNWSNFGAAISLTGTNSNTGNVAAQACFTFWGVTVASITGTGAAINAKLSA